MNKRFISFLLTFIALFLTLLPLRVNAIPGCCSSHGGEAGCRGTRTVCSDGWVSSCPCDGTSSNYGGSGSSSSSSYNNDDSGFWKIAAIGFVIFVVIYICIKIKQFSDPNLEKSVQEFEKKQRFEKYGTVFKSYEAYIDVFINKRYDSIEDMINDSFFKRIREDDLYRLLKKFYDDGDDYKYILDRLFELRKYNYNKERYTVNNKVVDFSINKLLYNVSRTLAFADKQYHEIIKYIIDKNYIGCNNESCYYGDLIITILIDDEYIKDLELVDYILENLEPKITIKKFGVVYNKISTTYKKYLNKLLKNSKVDFELSFDDLKYILEKDELIDSFFEVFNCLNCDSDSIRHCIVALIKKGKLNLLKKFLCCPKESLDDNIIEIIIHHSVRNKNIEILNWILPFEKKENIDRVYSDGHTHLLLAIRKNSIEIVKKLIEHGANVNVSGEFNVFPIEYAFCQKHYTICRYLFKQNVEYNDTIKKIEEYLKEHLEPELLPLGITWNSDDLIKKEKEYYKENI